MHSGFNTNVPYKGKMYHVQTEDGGARNPMLTTLLYYKGEISSKEDEERIARKLAAGM